MLKYIRGIFRTFHSKREKSVLIGDKLSKENLHSSQRLPKVTYVQPTSQLEPTNIKETLEAWSRSNSSGIIDIQPHVLESHSERGKIALIVASRMIRMQKRSEAQLYLQLAKSWGCDKKLIAQVLISGSHNTLARAYDIAGRRERSLAHLRESNSVLSAAKNIEPLGEDFTERKTLNNFPLDLLELLHFDTTAVIKNKYFECTKIATVPLSEAWAANTINTSIFRHHGVLSSGQFQYTSFYVDNECLRIVKRCLISGSIYFNDLIGKYNLKDAHNTINMGIDRKGYLHLCYDLHGTQLRYRRSTQPHCIEKWTDELAMTGKKEECVTYPTFINSQAEHPLILIYRDGFYNKGSVRIKIYDENAEKWNDLDQPILSGAENQPWTSSAYFNNPVLDKSGRLHLSFVWRTDSIGENQRVNNINIGYVVSKDNGLTWQTSLGYPCKIPVTQVNSETIYAVPPGNNLINQTGMAVNSLGHAHIVFYSNDKHKIPQYQHIWFDGKIWNHQFISNRQTIFNLEGRGTLRIPVSRPTVVIDKKNNVFIIYRGDLSNDRMAVLMLPYPDFQYNERNIQIICDDDLGFAEPVIDRDRWDKENILTLLIQKNNQPDGDNAAEKITSPISLIDVKFSDK